MVEQIIQILERDSYPTHKDEWHVRTVIQLWPYIPEERERLQRFIDGDPDLLSDDELAGLEAAITRRD